LYDDNKWIHGKCWQRFYQTFTHVFYFFPRFFTFLTFFFKFLSERLLHLCNRQTDRPRQAAGSMCVSVSVNVGQ